MRTIGAVAAVIVLVGASVGAGEDPKRLADAYADEVREINEAHARKPGTAREKDLGAKLSARAKRALDDLLRAEPGPGLDDALVACGEAALDLGRVDDLDRVRERAARVAPDAAARLGIALSRERFLLRGLGGLEPPYLERFADVLDAILGAYDDVFGFAEWSKVPGKKLRVRVHPEERITRPPHFAPQFPFHSEIDFPVSDAAAFASPTPDGKFLFYGLCHELGHVIAMWGDRDIEEDHHAWAHYTGVAIVERLAETRRGDPLLRDLKDVRWRSLAAERDRIEKERRAPSLADRDGVLALLVALHDAAGPKAIGAAINALDREGKSLRVHRVRYYRMKDFRAALLAALKEASKRRKVEALFAA